MMKVLQKSADEDFIVLNFTDTQLTDGGAIHNEGNVRTILINCVFIMVLTHVETLACLARKEK